MKKWHYIDHTADVCVELCADSFTELFVAAMLSMNDILYPGYRSAKKTSFDESQKFEIKAIDQTVLLVDFLSEVLTRSHQDKILFCHLKIKHLDNSSIRVEIFGNNVNQFLDDIKAVTYHEADVKQDENGIWTTRLIFDI